MLQRNQSTGGQVIKNQITFLKLTIPLFIKQNTNFIYSALFRPYDKQLRLYTKAQ